MNHRLNLANAVWQFDNILINNVIALCIFKICEIYNLWIYIFKFMISDEEMRSWKFRNLFLFHPGHKFKRTALEGATR